MLTGCWLQLHSWKSWQLKSLYENLFKSRKLSKLHDQFHNVEFSFFLCLLGLIDSVAYACDAIHLQLKSDISALRGMHEEIFGMNSLYPFVCWKHWDFALMISVISNGRRLGSRLTRAVFFEINKKKSGTYALGPLSCPLNTKNDSIQQSN